MKRVIATLAAASVVTLAMVLPATASAETFEVDTLESEANGSTACIEVGFECSLRDAIERANATTELDVIDFSELFAGTIELDEPLPPVLWPVKIDATTAADYSDAGHPVIVLDGSEMPFTEPRGIEIMETGGGSRVEGLSIGGFHLGIFAYGETPSFICGNYVGVLPDGETALPNVYAGITNASISKGLRIGAECAAGGNLISGNEEFGILEAGEGTLIKGNRIGVDADGEPLPNGDALLPSAGIDVNDAAKEPVIGGTAPGEGNVIAYNEGQGVRVRNTASAVTIRGNSIYSNLLGGIQVDAGTPTAVPELEFVYPAGGGAVTVLGTINGVSSEHYDVDVYASKACDPGGSGEGETYLGALGTDTGPTGFGSFSASALDPAPVGSEFFTLTATAAATGSTSIFSNCVVPSAPPPPPDSPKPPIQPLAQAQLVPENGETLAAEPVSGVIYIKLPGTSKQVKLTEGMLIPVGAVVDATKGKVTLTSVNKAGEAQTAVFYGGKFVIAEQERNGLVVLKLRGVLRCGKARPSVATASAGSKGRRLWGSGKGKFRTEGNNASATVRGTIWLTEDRCDGTFVKVRRGVVSVRDFTAGQTFSLPAGKSYLAKSP